MASLGLSTAFDIVNINILIKCPKTIGIPDGVVDLIGIWLTDQSFYESINGQNSILFDLICSTIQGSILGPIIYAIYVSPLFYLFQLANLADNNL
jgi:hypothetical protein